jgi:arginine kinase
MCVKSGVQHPSDPIGVMATDEEAYKSFSDLFGPIIKDLHPKFDFRYSYKFDDLTSNQMEQQVLKLYDYQYQLAESTSQISFRRNFRGMPFSTLMTREAKLQIERKVVEVLGELYGQYHQVSRMEENIRQWLGSIGHPIQRTAIHDAAGINDDWPVGRGVFIEEHNNFIVKVNFEDHIEIILLSQQPSGN